MRSELRNFAVDSIRRCEILEKPAREIGSRTLQAVLGPGYGIFAGKDLTWASLRFSAERARWVAAEQWHPRQKGRFEEDGRYILEIPYADDRELVMDILRHGDHAEVLGPPQLRSRVREEVRRLHERYG